MISDADRTCARRGRWRHRRARHVRRRGVNDSAGLDPSVTSCPVVACDVLAPLRVAPPFPDASQCPLGVAVPRPPVDSLSELYDRYAGAVYSLALHLLGDVGEAEALTIEMFRERGTHPAAPVDEERACLLWATRLCGFQRLRALGRTPQPGAGPLRPTGSRDYPVRTAMATLLAVQRSVLELTLYDGQTVTEIAQILAQPEATIRSALISGLRRLCTVVNAAVDLP